MKGALYKLFRQNLRDCRATLGNFFQQPIYEARHCVDILKKEALEGDGL